MTAAHSTELAARLCSFVAVWVIAAMASVLGSKPADGTDKPGDDKKGGDGAGK